MTQPHTSLDATQNSPVQAPEPKVIATLPPIEELDTSVPLSSRTGEPRRPLAVLIAAIASYLSIAALALAYALHWWQAVRPDAYPRSARLIGWLAPQPGNWLSLTLEAILAAALVLAAGAVGVVGFQAWNGWRWTRWAGLVSVGLVGGFTLVVNNWGFIGLGLALVSAVLIFLPPVRRYFDLWQRVRNKDREGYRRPPQVIYGRLPRFR